MKERVGYRALNLSPELSSAWDMQPMFNVAGYTTLTMPMAAVFTLAQSCITLSSTLLPMPILTKSVPISSLASSSPFKLWKKINANEILLYTAINHKPYNYCQNLP